MFNSRDILGSLLQAGVGNGGRQPTSRRVEHAIGRDGSGGSLGRMLQDMASGRGGGGGGLGSILGGVLGGGAGSGRSGAGAGGGGLGGIGDLLRGAGAGGGLGGLGGMLGGGGGTGTGTGAGGGSREFGRNPAAMGGLGALAGAILGGGRGNTMRGAVGGAGLAVLGSLALDALARREQRTAGGGTAPVPPPDPEAAVPSDEAGQERLASLLMRAMLSAAKADGHIDGKEMERILGKLDEQGADSAAKDLVLSEMRRPPDIQGLAAEARTPEVAAQVYAASLLAIEVDTQAERDYLRRLADALRLDAATVARLHESLGAAPAGTSSH